MNLSAEKKDEQSGFRGNGPQPFSPIERNEFSEHALLLLDHYRVDDANDPITIIVSIFDKMSVHQREVISRFEAAIALADVEFGRIDLAIGKAEEIQKEVKILTIELNQTQKNLHLTMNKIRQRSNLDILLNHLRPVIYGLFGAILTLLVVSLGAHLKIL